MEYTKSERTTSSISSNTKRKRNEPKFYAVRVGRTPGIYHSWNDCFEQIKGFKNSLFKSFPSLTEAEAFLKDEEVSSPSSSIAPTKFYAVANGRTPGVYTDWPSAQKQITGWTKPKHKSFATKAEAEAFMTAHANDSPGRALSNASIEPDESPVPSSKRAAKTENTTRLAKRRRKVSEAAVNGGDYEPGEAPLLSDGEDGFDATIKLNPATGKVEYKTEEERNAIKLQSTGEPKGGCLVIYTDGAASKNGQDGARAGVGVYFGPNDARNLSERLSGPRQTNQRAELTAIQRALEIAPIDRRVEIYSDSKYAINCLTEWLPTWRQNGWLNASKKPIENRDLVEAIVNKIELRARFGPDATRFKWVKGHSKDPNNEAADKLAVNGAMQAPVE